MLIESPPKDKNDQDSSNDGSDGETYQGYPKLGSREMAIWKCGLDIEITGHTCCMLALEVDKKWLINKFINELLWLSWHCEHSLFTTFFLSFLSLLLFIIAPFILDSIYIPTIHTTHLSPLYRDWGEPLHLPTITLLLTLPRSPLTVLSRYTSV